jgi:hypothetical protein
MKLAEPDEIPARYHKMQNSKDNSILLWLQQWYANQTDGEWEHKFGIEISTLDNPGWYLEANLKDTDLEGASFEKVALERTDDNWVRCSVDGEIFKGACGPKNLIELLDYFRNFASGPTESHRGE